MLQVIKAEEVRDGEPRIWIETPQPVMHTESRRDRGCQPCGFAIVDRPAPTPTADPLATVRAALDVASKATTGEWECEPVDVFGTLTEWAALIGPRRPGRDWPRKSDLRQVLQKLFYLSILLIGIDLYKVMKVPFSNYLLQRAS